MNILTTDIVPTTPIIQTREQFDTVIENIVDLRLQRAQIECDQEAEIAGVREKYCLLLAELERYLTLETAWAETWARANTAALSQDRSLACPCAMVRFDVASPRIDRASRKWTWTAIAAKLAETAWGRRYLRTPAPEVDKEALLADHAQFSEADLRLAGLKLVSRERFLVIPHNNVESITAAEQPWREAA